MTLTYCACLTDIGRLTFRPVFDLSVDDCRMLGRYKGRSGLLHWQIVIGREGRGIVGELLCRKSID